ncbi:PKD domain-containing protein [Zobellia nedashkovskayae]|uniref:PKD domain-containing protein n=1 Tax=Zobellia nedashkovskayae TaxID=2779510 RepID=UPI00188BC4B6|nr:PKD domain-containing protein [Zobellia nedashkovskayae]
MKAFKYIITAIILSTLVWSCENDTFGETDFVNGITAPANISAGVNVTPDNTGLTKITPTSDGAASYSIDFGDGSEPSESLTAGEYVEHIYAEGTYEIKITATSVNGKSATNTQTINVSFKAPENLVINSEIDGTNPFLLNVTASANFASSYLVYFDTANPDEEGTPLEIDGAISHEYQGVGEYTIKVVALSGGTTTTELEQLITISAPVELPIDFELFDDSVFIGFGGASAAVIDNPDTNGNDSAMVGQIVKGGPEVWAGNVITLSAPIDFSIKKVINVKVWSPRSDGKLVLKIENLDDSTINIEKEITLSGNSTWEEVTFDFSDIDESQSYQKLVFFFDFGAVGDGGTDWTFYIDDITQNIPSSGATGLPGQWIMAPEGGALGVGPAFGDTSWWNCDDACVAERACFYDDIYIFGQDGSFKNDLGTETWTEAWQGGTDSCGTLIAPHDGSNPATYTYDEGAGTITLNGVGAFIGIPKPYNGGELASPADAPASITYNIEFLDNDTISFTIDAGGAFWHYKLIRAGEVTTPLTGTWQMAQEGGALGVGPANGDTSWWNCDAACVGVRACYYDDLFVFGADGSFQNVLGTETWTEAWQGGADSCGAPVAPHDGSVSATYTYDSGAGTFTLNGKGSFIGIPKPVNGAELTSPDDAPDAIIYNVTFDNDNTMNVSIDAGGAFWQYKLVKI